MNEPVEAPRICPIPLDALPPMARRAVDPSSPIPARMMAARGMAPMQPRELVTAQFALTFDLDAKVKESAEKSLANLDPRIANAVLGDAQLSPHVLEYLAAVLAYRDAEIERILLNPSTPERAYVHVAELCSEHVAEIIANNQARLLKAPEIARALTRNPHARKATVDRVIDFLVRNSIILDDAIEFERALLRLTGEERLKMADAVDLPKEFLEGYDGGDDEDGEQRLIEDEGEGTEEDDGKRKSIEMLLRTMSTGQKVAFATKGNKTVRKRLMTDANRVVALAAITSPAITETEIAEAARSRVVHGDVIQYISNQKDFTKNYQIRLALVQNPKTPVPKAMAFVNSLQKRDIKQLAVNKSVPSPIRTLAMKMRKTQGGDAG